tara:strand:+ start:562 stop:756 length:195 start_codon:yes stop_codon:yes gene_type:complete
MSKPSFKEILAERQDYLDALKTQGDVYALGFLESSFLYDCGNYGISPLNTAQHATLAKWKETTQ